MHRDSILTSRLYLNIEIPNFPSNTGTFLYQNCRNLLRISGNPSSCINTPIYSAAEGNIELVPNDPFAFVSVPSSNRFVVTIRNILDTDTLEVDRITWRVIKAMPKIVFGNSTRSANCSFQLQPDSTLARMCPEDATFGVDSVVLAYLNQHSLSATTRLGSLTVSRNGNNYVFQVPPFANIPPDHKPGIIVYFHRINYRGERVNEHYDSRGNITGSHVVLPGW